MSVYLSPSLRKGNRNLRTVTADAYWELQRAAALYGVRIIGNRKEGFHLDVPEQKRTRGISLEQVVPGPKPRKDPRGDSWLGVASGDSATRRIAKALNAVPVAVRAYRRQAGSTGAVTIRIQPPVTRE